jgi:uncharacterized protein YndB with AHSA1/START domain
MNDAAVMTNRQEIVVDEVFPHAPETIWKVLTTGEMLDRWLMKSNGFQAVTGTHFELPTKPDGEWDGIIRCHVLEVIPNQRLVYSWKSGHQSATGYVPRLDTVVTWTLTRHDGGTRLRLVHSGFELPRNVSVFQNIGKGWPIVIGKLMAIVEAGAVHE